MAYPDDLDTVASLYAEEDSPTSTLASPSGVNPTQLELTDASVFAKAGGQLRVDDGAGGSLELLTFTGVSGSLLTGVTGGIHPGLPSIPHAAGSVVRLTTGARKQVLATTAIANVEATLGTNPEGGYPNVADRLDAMVVGGGGTTPEQIQDSAGSMFSGNTQDGVSSDYDDPTGKVNLVNTDKGSTAVTAHLAAGDPHPQYLTSAEGNAAYDVTGAAAAGDAAHVAAPDPHPQYLTAAEGNAAYDSIGAASTGDAAHVAAGDPHPQYLTSAEGDAAYDAVGTAAAGDAAHVAAGDPHPQYTTAAEAATAAPVQSVHGRTGAVTALQADYDSFFTTPAEATTIADASVAAHAAAADPHTGYQKESEKAAASGYASLDATTKVPVAQLGTGSADATKFLRGDRSWQVVALTATDMQVFTANGTWTKPAGAKWVKVIAFGGGGGGTYIVAGGGGGGGGACTVREVAADLLDATADVEVGLGGDGSPLGVDGLAGALSLFNLGTLYISAGGGAGGLATGLGGGGGGSIGNGSGNNGGIPAPPYSKTGDNVDGESGADGGAAGSPGGCAYWGGGGGGGGTGTGGSALHGAGGGGGGRASAGTNAAGSTNTYSPGAALVPIARSGSGWSGDGGLGRLGDGDDGFAPGGGGGGAGGSTSTSVGGNGARGEVIVLTFF